eukprot:CAMPEP_0197434030 /NCGR_PEP_ID=MMETSP1175-20131217/1811_1 /TAXON_ID=1003142 /ORGANISM="Triceratium dubium, Strain CCMP147" /LENGTH=590 /DNA_ID=CAMNT_0042962601 /DNA_START=76 /DNA_END=1848 /DNA_ORIENTATION=-
MQLLHPTCTLAWCLFMIGFASVSGNLSDYKSRQAQLRDLAKTNNVHRGAKSIVRSYLNQGVDQGEIASLLGGLEQDQDAAMRIVILTRICMLTNDESARQSIKDKLAPIPFWLEPGETVFVYWTENQQIMWMSSAWLLRENYPGLLQYNEPTLRARLLHYLRLKDEYDFFEFFSSVYTPYTLQGLLNLADFCVDEEIRSLAEKVARKLLSNILLLANDEGAFYPASGRNYVDYYLGTKAVNDIIWSLTDLGQAPNFLSHIGAFLATSTMDVNSVMAGFSPEVDQTVSVRPSLGQTLTIDESPNRVDCIIINDWGAGAYFHPAVSDDTQWVLEIMDLWDHKEFSQYEAFSSLPSFIGNIGSEYLSSVTSSSVLGGHDVRVFKDRSVTLSSVPRFWPGHLGYQAWPWAAAVGTKAVWTQSGKVEDNWQNRPGSPANTHLPSVIQNGNMALIMYNPLDDLERVKAIAPDSPLDVDHYEVALHWPKFEEEIDAGHWKFGRDGDGYVAVFRHCLLESAQGTPYCGPGESINGKYQAWAVIVGNSDKYTSFENFRSRISTEALYVAEMRTRGWWIFKEDYYFGSVEFDGIKITAEL